MPVFIFNLTYVFTINNMAPFAAGDLKKTPRRSKFHTGYLRGGSIEEMC